MKDTSNLGKSTEHKSTSLDREEGILRKSKEQDSLIKRVPMDLRKGGLR